MSSESATPGTTAKARRLALASVLMLVALAGYGVGYASGLSAVRGGELLRDVLDPAHDARAERERRNQIRSYAKTLATEQASSIETGQDVPAVDHAEAQASGMVVEARAGTRGFSVTGAEVVTWTAVVRHMRSPIGEACAVALNVDRAYLSGIPLTRSGEVRCSWDAATRFNRWRS